METRERHFIQLPSKVTTTQLDGGSNYNMFTDIKLLDYIRPLKCNLQILNGIKYLAKSFGLVIIKKSKTNIIIPLYTSYYMPQNRQNTINQTALKHYNEFRSFRTYALSWVKMTTYTGMKTKVETSAKGRDQQRLYLVTIDILKLDQQHTSGQDIINLSMNRIMNISFNKHPMSWEIIHCRILHPSYSVMKEM